MRTSDFEYELPPELIAQTPAEPRDSARLMVVRVESEAIEHHRFSQLPELLAPGDLLVFNDTRVMAARLHGRRLDTAGRVEALLIRRTGPRTWETLFRPSRQAVHGREFVFEATDGPLAGRTLRRAGSIVEFEFTRDFDPAAVGDVPLPPYIKNYRGDPERYQTVYSREARSVAAPTAGLHFTPGLLERLRARRIESATVTLEVGPGTFRPVATEDPREHELHAEHVTVPSEAAEAVRQAKAEGRRVVAVGTTVVRTLEHVARERGEVTAYEGWTALKILPGDEFRVVDVLITNFHLPRSTLLMLVSAFAGRDLVLRAYREAVKERYRLYSFGDAMLLFP